MCGFACVFVCTCMHVSNDAGCLLFLRPALLVSKPGTQLLGQPCCLVSPGGLPSPDFRADITGRAFSLGVNDLSFRDSMLSNKPPPHL